MFCNNDDDSDHKAVPRVQENRETKQHFWGKESREGPTQILINNIGSNTDADHIVGRRKRSHAQKKTMMKDGFGP